MSNKILSLTQKIIELGFYTIFLIVPLFWNSYTSEVFEFNKMILTFGLTVIIAGGWAVKSILKREIIFKKTILDIPLVLFLLSQIVSTISSTDQHLSFWGYYSRINGGLLSTFAYLVLYWAFVSNMRRESVLKAARCLLLSGIVISLWGILEHFGVSLSCVFLKGEFNDDCWVQDVQARVFATLGQPNWMAAWISAIAPLSWSLLATNNKKKETKLPVKIFLYFLPIAYLLSLLFTQSRSGLYGFIGAYAIFWGLAFLTKRYIPRVAIFKTFSLLLLSLITITVLFGSRATPTIFELVNPKAPSTNPEVVSQHGTESGDIRKIVWKGAFDIWKHYPIFGSGVETFAESYYNFRPKEHNQTSEWDLLYNKAHNEYLNYLANTGLVGLGTYLLIIAVFLRWSLKEIKKNNSSFSLYNLAFFAGWASILVTNFFGFSVVVVNTLFFLFPAMGQVLSLKEQTTKNMQYRIKIKTFFLLTFALCFSLFLLFIIVRLWLADYHYNLAGINIKKGLYLNAVFQAKETLDIKPDEPLYYDKLASAVSHLALQSKEAHEEDKAKELADISQKSAKTALEISPRNLTLLKSSAVILNRLALVDSNYLKEAVFPLEKAVELAPTEPESFYSLGVIYSSLEENDKALIFLEKAVDLKPDYYNARVGLGQVYAKLKQKEKAKENFQWTLDHLNPEDKEVKEAIENLK